MYCVLTAFIHRCAGYLVRLYRWHGVSVNPFTYGKSPSPKKGMHFNKDKRRGPGKG